MTRIERRHFRTLLLAMSQPRTFYLLGAGASSGLIPTTNEMRHHIEADIHSVGVYQTMPMSCTPLSERVVGVISPNEQDLRKVLLMHIPSGALDIIAQRALWRPSNAIIPTQYALFDVVGSPATLCNFNLDGLASRYCNHRHLVLEMHGRIDGVRFEQQDYKELLEAAVIYNINFRHLAPKLMPQPESQSVTEQQTYFQASRLLRQSRAVIIIGYSFGQRSEGFDDAHSFEFFAALLKKYPKPVFVISLTPHDLAETMRDRLLSKNVFAMSLRWEQFSGAILANSDPIKGMDARWLHRNYDLVMRSYEEALDTI